MDSPSDEPLRRPGTPSESDLPPEGGEAEQQRSEGVMPIVWIALGLIAVLLFVVFVIGGHGLGHGAPPSPLPAPHG